MSGRPTKRLRRLSTDDTDSEASDDTPTTSSMNGRNAPYKQLTSHTDGASRARRGVPATATIDKGNPSGSDASKRSIRLTVKAPPSKLREVTSRSNLTSPVNSRNSLSRSSKNKRPIIDASSDEDDVEVEEEDDEDEDETNAVEEDEGTSEDDADMDDYDDSTIKVAPAPASVPRKLSPTRTLKLSTKIKSVEEKEQQQPPPASDDESLSELDSASNDDDEEDDDQADNNDNDMDMEEGDDTIAADAIGEDELDTSSDERSRSGTPDLSKLTRRQRAALDEGNMSEAGDGAASASGAAGLLALSNDPQKKKFFTNEELSMRRVEMARRRKDLSEKRNDQEKEDTLHRLLHKKEPKRRTRAQILADELAEAGTPLSEGEVARANPLYVRTIMTNEGTRVGVPEEWLAAPVGRVFAGARRFEGVRSEPRGGLIQVVQEEVTAS